MRTSAIGSEVRDVMSRALSAHNPSGSPTEPHLAAALTDAVTRPGRLARSELALQAASRHGVRPEAGEQLACALEFWHQASLILDDLPCMDDADQRRGRRCIHRTHGEATAILTALALINRAYSLVQRAYLPESAEVRETAANLVDRALGASGMLCGQAWDLRFSVGSRLARDVGRIAERKTGSLLWLALSLPVLPSGLWSQERRPLRALSVYWSLAFQAMDDLLDVTAPANVADKTTGRDAALDRPNLTIALGAPLCRLRIVRCLSLAERQLQALCRRDAKWTYLADWHERWFLARYRLLVAA